MRRMVYIIVSTVGVLLSVIIFAGCTGAPQNNSAVVGISLSQSHMEYTESYNFFLRKEEKGEVLFDADVRFQEEPYEVILESISIDEKYFDRLMELEKRFSVNEHVKSGAKKQSFLHVPDKTTNTTTVYYADGGDATAKSGEYKDALYEFFTELALEYINESVSTR